MKQHLNIFPLLTCVLALNAMPVYAYDPDTHQKMSEIAFGASAVATDTTLLDNLGLPPLAAKKKYPNSQLIPSQREILELFQDGANFEDGGTRSTNHFFDPLTGNGLTGYSSSPDWAIDGTGDTSAVQFSFKAAREYLWQAVANGNNSYAYRQKQFGLMFETLGHVIHHVQDMAQPQHVRNDLHCDIIPCYLIGQHNPSLYESFTKTEGMNQNLTYVGYDPVYSSADTTTFNMARKFWTTTTNNNNGKGMAEYTNRGFVSAGTNFDKATYAQPALSSATALPTDIATLCAEDVAAGYAPCTAGLSGAMTMYSSTVTDNYRTSETKINPRTSTQSIYDQDLIDAGKGQIFSLNRFNFHAAQNLLIPRAVGYSAGLINYFFRGKMEISLPDEGVYAIVDHSLASAFTKDTGGFNKIKLKVQNSTPSATVSPELMTAGGQLIAVVKFRRNNCYEPLLLQGQPGGPAYSLDTTEPCKTKMEEIVVSNNTIASTDAINSGSKQAVTFTFDPVIPINATDVYLQVVFRGVLGNEAGAVVVATKDISEPTIFSIDNYSDCYRDSYTGIYYTVAGTDITTSIRFNSGTDYIVGVQNRHPGSYSRFAFLADNYTYSYNTTEGLQFSYQIGVNQKNGVPVGIENPMLYMEGRPTPDGSLYTRHAYGYYVYVNGNGWEGARGCSGIISTPRPLDLLNFN